MTNVFVECIAPINIAVLKYWGKRDETLVLPLHTSLSLTLHTDAMASHIRVNAQLTSDEIKSQDSMTLNEHEVDISSNSRLISVLQACREQAAPFVIQTHDEESRDGKAIHKFELSKEDIMKLQLHLECSNNFPTAAGLASSASGYACLTHALCTLFGVSKDLSLRSAIARSGSGSACRSMEGGFVAWTKGNAADGTDSHAQVIADEHHWPEMRVLVMIANAKEKDVSSTIGMKRSVDTSDLLRFRAESLVDKRMTAMCNSLRQRDFHSFAELTMKDSNQFHAVCLDSYPPIFYLNETSKKIIADVHEFNAIVGFNRAAYSFDAGPNACIFTLDKHMPELMRFLLERYSQPNVPMQKFVMDPMNLCPPLATLTPHQEHTSGVNRIIITKVGPGPQTIDGPRVVPKRV